MKIHILLLFLFIISVSCVKTGNNAIPTSSKKNNNSNSSMYRGPIIDMHIHAYNGPSPFFGLDYLNPLTGKTYKAATGVQDHQNQSFAMFKKHNIVKAMVSQGQDWYKIDSSIVLIGLSHKNPSILRERHKAGKLHVLGEIAPNYEGKLPGDSSLVKYFDLATELNIPIGFHLFPGGPPGGAYFIYPKTRAFQAKPLQMEEILFSRPKIKIYIMHGGWPYLEDMKALMYAHPQVYIDVSVINWVLPRAEFHNFLRGLVDSGFGERIMFGSDQMVWVNTMDEAIEAINTAEFLTIEQKADIFYNNAAKFLDLSKEEIQKHKTQSKNN